MVKFINTALKKDKYEIEIDLVDDYGDHNLKSNINGDYKITSIGDLKMQIYNNLLKFYKMNFSYHMELQSKIELKFSDDGITYSNYINLNNKKIYLKIIEKKKRRKRR